MQPFRHIVAPTDFSPLSQHALDAAIMMAERFGAELSLVHIVEVPFVSDRELSFEPMLGLIAEEKQRVIERLEGLKTELAGRGITAHVHVKSGPVWREILDVAEKSQADLIVMSTHGHTGLTRVLIGSTAEKIVRLSPVPVLSLHGPTPTP